jgi:thiol-disulfide isomerase/thioredoxin
VEIFFSPFYRNDNYLNSKVFNGEIGSVFAARIFYGLCFKTSRFHNFSFMKILPLICLVVFCGRAAVAQEIPVIKLEELENILEYRDKEILVVNFWATWCAPCVKELPYFEALHKQNPNARVVLISLDFADKVDRVESFVGRKNIESEVLLLDEMDYNSWIDKVDTSWQGAIPATLILNTKTGQRKFVARELAEGQLDTLIKEISKG